jgi:hypothetical protein
LECENCRQVGLDALLCYDKQREGGRAAVLVEVEECREKEGCIRN